MAVAQPAGTVTLVFTDIEGSTRLLEELGVDAYRDALAVHRRLVRDACARYGGYEVDYEGDAFFFAFAAADAAVSAVGEVMVGLLPGPIRIRVGVHTGEPALDPPKYLGLDVHRAARIMSAAHGGQVVVSRETAESLAAEAFVLVDLGDHRFKDLGAPERVYQLGEGEHPPLKSLGSFRDGWFYIQDPSTLLAVSELGAQPGETVLDLCAAPGGKATFIAQQMNNEGKIIAHDSFADRLKLIRENCTRLGVTCAEVTATFNFQLATFDRILVDAPCSNTGVMRRRVDLRWLIQPAEIERLRATQLALLNQAATVLKPGGVLVYSTCSLEPEENSEVVKEFLREHENFKLESERQLLPFADNVDGAYVARLNMCDRVEMKRSE